MSFSLLIDDVEYICNLFRDSFVITESLQVNGATMSGKIQLNAGQATPVAGNTIVFYMNGVKEFAGRISSVSQDDSVGPTTLQYTINCQDWTPDLDAHLIPPQTLSGPQAGDIVREIVRQSGRNFSAAGVDSGPEVADVETNYDTASSLITQLAEPIEHQWYIDYDRVVQFFFIRTYPAPVTDIDFDTDVSGAYSDLVVGDDASQVKNVIVLTGAQVKSSNRDTIAWKADGDTRFFPLNYQPTQLSEVTVRVDNAPVALELDGQNSNAGDGGSGSGAYVCLDNWGVRFPDESPPAEDAQVDVSYRYYYDAVVIVEDPDSIAYMAARENSALAPSDGRHEFKFDVPEIKADSEQLIVDYGNLILARYAYPIIPGSFHSIAQGWKAGQYFVGRSTRRSINTTFYVSRVTKRFWQVAGTQKFQYDVEVSSSPFPQ